MSAATILQTIIVLLVVAIALVYVLRRVIATMRDKGDCGCGCGTRCKSKKAPEG